MTKKDYQALAGALYSVRRDYANRPSESLDSEAILADVVWSIANVLEDDNARFSRETFIQACQDGNVNRRPKR